MCGFAPVTAMLAALTGEPLTGRLLRWGHSGEVARMRDVVGYAAIVFESASPLPPAVK
jgi:AmmeMemoRadiSam system protein B